MKVFLTGGAGFIGSHLAERLITEGHEVLIVDDLNDFYSPALKLQNLAAIESRGPVKFVNADICDHGEMLKLVGSQRPDVIVHLAARAGVRPSLAQPLLYERVNVYGTTVLLEAARTHGVPKFVFASSSSIYGIADQVPFREAEGAQQPVSPYAATKISGEKICFTYSHLYPISVVCLRFFTVFGPRQRPDLAIRKFAEMIEAGQPIPVFGDGSSGRDYTYVTDIVDGILRAANGDFGFEVFNLGNSSPVLLSDLISTLEQVIGKKAQIQLLPPQPGDVPITFADISKASRLLGYAPTTSFRQGLENFIEWHRHTRSNSSAFAGMNAS